MSSIELDSYAKQARDDYLQALADLSAAEQRKAKARDILECFLADHQADAGTVDSQVAVTRNVASRARFDDKTFKQEQQYLYEKYLTVRDVITIRVS